MGVAQQKYHFTHLCREGSQAVGSALDRLGATWASSPQTPTPAPKVVSELWVCVREDGVFRQPVRVINPSSVFHPKLKDWDVFGSLSKLRLLTFVCRTFPRQKGYFPRFVGCLLVVGSHHGHLRKVSSRQLPSTTKSMRLSFFSAVRHNG